MRKASDNFVSDFFCHVSASLRLFCVFFFWCFLEAIQKTTESSVLGFLSDGINSKMFRILIQHSILCVYAFLGSVCVCRLFCGAENFLFFCEYFSRSHFLLLFRDVCVCVRMYAVERELFFASVDSPICFRYVYLCSLCITFHSMFTEE